GRTLRSNQRFYRCSQTSNGPWWFSSSGDGRFDLRAPRGTCYLATDPIVAVREALGPTEGRRIVTSRWFEQRSVRLLRLPRAVRVASVVEPAASRHGVTLEINTVIPYTVPQAWAEAFDVAGFGGVAYLLRHSASPERGIALFSAAGERTSWRRGIASPLAPSIVRALERRFGIEVVDPPSTRSLTLSDPPM
ncbi:MAG TPA: RES domain-containing protein, partial [Actinobacteria bacterium]|nr:RES domain-containing protein [Actinomycetota bacterium]